MKNTVYNCPENQTYVLKFAFKTVVNKYGVEIARNTERIIRLETAHFTSNLWIKYNNAGMQAVENDFPYGWESMRKLWGESVPKMVNGVIPLKENKQKDVKGSGIIQSFIIFSNPLAQILSIATFLLNHDNDAGDWFAAKESEQIGYEAKINSIRARFV